MTEHEENEYIKKHLGVPDMRIVGQGHDPNQRYFVLIYAGIVSHGEKIHIRFWYLQ